MSGLDSLGLQKDVSLAGLTTYKLGGPAAWFADVSDKAELESVGEAAVADRVPVFVLGRGSNVVVSDRGFPGLVLRLSGEFAHIEHTPESIVAGGAVPLPVLARSAVSEGRLGLEFFVGIPGSVGGAVRQNAGCHGSETKDVLVSADVFDLDSASWSVSDPTDLEMAYRHSSVRPRQVVAMARFRFTPGSPEEGEAKLREITRWRRDNQPGGTFNAGSVFKNPPGDSAGRIIDSIGLKGFAVGETRVSPRHANFFESGPGATAADLHRLVVEVRQRVAEATGVMLEPEILFIGEF